jgi:Mg2+-importing ATPase
MKYIIMGTSSNFGNMFSMAAASLFLPFLPTQILLNNFLYDLSQINIPSDNVDPALLHRPKRWQIGFIRQEFMMIIGPISSIYDFLTFGVLLCVFHASTNAPLFHTGWFVESLATQTLVVFVTRTAGNPFKSRAGRPLLIGVLAVVAIAVVLPYRPGACWDLCRCRRRSWVRLPYWQSPTFWWCKPSSPGSIDDVRCFKPPEPSFAGGHRDRDCNDDPR